MSEGVLYAIVALGIGGFTFFMYLKNLSKSSQPKKVINSEDEELSRILKLQELELQNKQKKENSLDEIRKLEDPLHRKKQFESSYTRNFPDREITPSPIQQITPQISDTVSSVEKKEEQTPQVGEEQNKLTPSNEQTIEEENKRKEEEKQRVENLRIEAEKKARAENVRKQTLDNFILFQQRREELREKEKAKKEQENVGIQPTLFS